jgi:hypothetical protein
MQGYKLAGSTGCAFSNVDESESTAVLLLGMLDFDYGVTEPSPI